MAPVKQKTFKAKDNETYSIKHYPERRGTYAIGKHEYEVFNRRGEKVSGLTLRSDIPVVGDVSTKPSYQKRGIASALYKHVEADQGIKIEPSAFQSEAGMALTKSRARSAQSAPIATQEHALPAAEAPKGGMFSRFLGGKGGKTLGLGLAVTGGALLAKDALMGTAEAAGVDPAAARSTSLIKAAQKQGKGLAEYYAAEAAGKGVAGRIAARGLPLLGRAVGMVVPGVGWGMTALAAGEAAKTGYDAFQNLPGVKARAMAAAEPAKLLQRQIAQKRAGQKITASGYSAAAPSGQGQGRKGWTNGGWRNPMVQAAAQAARRAKASAGVK